jgi:hypothetical protein
MFGLAISAGKLFYKFRRFGIVDGPKPYEFKRFEARRPSTLSMFFGCLGRG